MFEIKFAGTDAAEIFAQMNQFLQATQPAQPNQVAPAVYGNPVQPAMPVYPQAVQPAPLQPTAFQPPAPPAAQSAPPEPSTANIAAPIPTAAPAYTVEDLMNAAGQLVPRVGMPAMQQLLAGRFGVQAVTQLPQERYGEFAQALREMGGAI